jgi:hypothetical protein
VRGWRKNVFAGGREAMPLGAARAADLPVLLLLPAAAQLWPLAVLLAAWAGLVTDAVRIHASMLAVGHAALLGRHVPARRGSRRSGRSSIPIGAGTYAPSRLQAILRGSRVEWRGREYLSATGPA